MHLATQVLLKQLRISGDGWIFGEDKPVTELRPRKDCGDHLDAKRTILVVVVITGKTDVQQ